MIHWLNLRAFLVRERNHVLSRRAKVRNTPKLHFAELKEIGTEPSENVPPVVVKMLAEDGLDVSGYQPRRVTPLELQSAARMISIGCTPDELREAAMPVEYWDDVPMVSQDAQGSREAIRRHITDLIQALKHG